MKKRLLEIRKKQEKGHLINYHEWCSANSYMGWLTWCDSWRLFEKYVEPIIPALCDYYIHVIKKGSSCKNKVLQIERYKQKLLKKKGRCIA